MKNVLDLVSFVWVERGVPLCVDWWVSGLRFAFELNYISAAHSHTNTVTAPSAVWQFVIFSKWQVTLPAVLDQRKLHSILEWRVH